MEKVESPCICGREQAFCDESCVRELRETPLYLACLKLKGRSCLVVGGGEVGLQKVEGLLACDAEVTLIAPEAVAELEEYAREGSIRWLQRTYRGGEDLAGHFLVIAATDDTELNRRIYADAEARAMLVNVVDVPALCNFILPAIVRNGPIAVAISTAGSSPALAKRMAAEIGRQFGEPYAKLATLLAEARPWAKRTLPTYQDRKRFFERIVRGTPDPIELLERGDEAGVRALIEDVQAQLAGELAARS